MSRTRLLVGLFAVLTLAVGVAVVYLAVIQPEQQQRERDEQRRIIELTQDRTQANIENYAESARQVAMTWYGVSTALDDSHALPAYAQTWTSRSESSGEYLVAVDIEVGYQCGGATCVVDSKVDEAVAADFRVICPEGRAEFAVSSSSAFIAPLNDCAMHFLSSDLSVSQMSTATPMPTATPTRTPIPTPTADPCRREIIAAPIADMNRLMTDFLQAGTVYSATFSPVALQAMGNASTAFAELRVPACLREAKDEGIAFMRLNYEAAGAVLNSDTVRFDEVIEEMKTHHERHLALIKEAMYGTSR